MVLTETLSFRRCRRLFKTAQFEHAAFSSLWWKEDESGRDRQIAGRKSGRSLDERFEPMARVLKDRKDGFTQGLGFAKVSPFYLCNRRLEWFLLIRQVLLDSIGCAEF